MNSDFNFSNSSGDDAPGALCFLQSSRSPRGDYIIQLPRCRHDYGTNSACDTIGADTWKCLLGLRLYFLDYSDLLEYRGAFQFRDELRYLGALLFDSVHIEHLAGAGHGNIEKPSFFLDTEIARWQLLFIQLRREFQYRMLFLGRKTAICKSDHYYDRVFQSLGAVYGLNYYRRLLFISAVVIVGPPSLPFEIFQKGGMGSMGIFKLESFGSPENRRYFF